MILGIRGKAGSGKSTVANHLMHQGWVKKAFAGRLKEASRVIFGLSHNQCYGDLKEVVDPRWGRTPRDLLQRVGESLRNNICIDVWIRPIIEESQLPDAKIVIEDTRYENEVEAILAAGGHIIDLQRRGHLSQSEAGSHASEVMTDLGHLKKQYPGRIHTINNEGWSKEELFQAVAALNIQD